MLDEIFKAYDIRGKVGEELSASTVHKIGRAFAEMLPLGVVVLGRDMRNDSAALSDAMAAGLQEQGREVWDMGLVTSDMVYFAIGKHELAGGAMITASHNPGEYNGIKLYRDEARPIGMGSGLETIKELVQRPDFSSVDKKGTKTEKRLIEEWVQHLLSLVNVDEFKKYKFAIDASNGMMGHILPHLEAQLPFEITRMYYELDGDFPNHEANPMKEENLTDLSKTIRENSLDFGVAFDGDGDRVAFVDETGAPIKGSVVISMLAERAVRRNPRAHIVFDVRSSKATEEIIAEAGGLPVRTKAGRTNISPKMREVNAPFGGETTGHLFFRDNYYTDSGALGMLRFIELLSETEEPLSALINRYIRYAKSPEINFRVNNKEQVIEHLAETFNNARQERIDGLTLYFDDWWFNVRASNTEPLLRLNVEAKDSKTLAERTQEITKILSKA